MSAIRSLIALALGILCVAPAEAQTTVDRDPGFLLAGASYHTGIQAKNEIHPALGLQTNRWSAGFFQNSDGNPSAWAARRWTRGHAFFEAGIAANYDISPVLPLVRAGVSFRHAEVFVMPAYGTNSENVGAAIVVQIRIDTPRSVSSMLTWSRKEAK